MAKNHGASIKNDAQYEALREQGYSKEKAARIANSTNIDYNSTPYDERTKDELYKQAKELEIAGRSKMTKDELMEALRDQS